MYFHYNIPKYNVNVTYGHDNKTLAEVKECGDLNLTANITYIDREGLVNVTYS